MADWLTYSLALVRWLPILINWFRRYRSRLLRTRYMGLTAAVGAFVSLKLPVSGTVSLRETSIPLGEAILTVFVASILFGATFFAWWPILGRDLRKIGILW